MKFLPCFLFSSVLALGTASVPAFAGPMQSQNSHPENSPSNGDQPSGTKAPTDGGQSPDTNQEPNGGNKKRDSHSPSANDVAPGGQSPDIQQEQNSKDNGGKAAKHTRKSGARQAHGTPQPKTDTATH